MKVLIVYDSVYGNTEMIAKAIETAISGETRIRRISEIDLDELLSADLLIMGSPTLGGRPTQAIQDFLTKLADGAIKGTRFAAFDTRYSGKFVKIFGFAAEKIASGLAAKGGTTVCPPEGFIVTGKRGPLKDGETERAAEWAKAMTN